MSILNEAADVKAPIAGRVIEMTISTTTAAYLIPESFAGCYCRFKVFADSGDISAYIAFGASTVNVVAAALSTIGGSGTITMVGTTGERIDSGSVEHWVMPAITSDTTHFAIDATAAGRLQIIKTG